MKEKNLNNFKFLLMLLFVAISAAAVMITFSFVLVTRLEMLQWLIVLCSLVCVGALAVLTVWRGVIAFKD